MELKELRQSKKLTQQQVADLVGISLRSYKSYENDKSKYGSIKYKYILDVLSEINKIDENHGILSVEDITIGCRKIFESYKVNFCILFGSYAKGKASENSDVDLLISTSEKGLKYYGLIEEIRVALNKRVDILDTAQLRDNLELTEEILKDGIKIYG